MKNVFAIASAVLFAGSVNAASVTVDFTGSDHTTPLTVVDADPCGSDLCGESFQYNIGGTTMDITTNGTNRVLGDFAPDHGGIGVIPSDSKSGDNVSFGESLLFTFGHEVTIDSIDFNNRSHGAYSGSLQMSIFDISDVLVSTQTISGVDIFSPLFALSGVGALEFSLLADEPNNEFYIGALTFEKTGGGRGLQQPPEVPIPASIWLFGSALLGLAGVSRNRKAA